MLHESVKAFPDGRPHHAPRAKNVIWIFLSGGYSQMETWDPKPALNKYAGLTIDEINLDVTIEGDIALEG